MDVDQAHARFKWPVAFEKAIAAPAPAVWDAISMPGNLEPCHPLCARNPVQSWPGPDSRDEVHYLNGLIYERRFRDWTDGIGYDLAVGERGGPKSSVSWRIRAIDDRCCVLRIAVNPHPLQSIPAPLRRVPYRLWLRPRLEAYLESVVRGFEWYVTRGEPVPREAFGRHPWFSSKAPAID